MRIRATIVVLLTVLFFAPVFQAVAMPAAPAASAVAHGEGTQADHASVLAPKGECLRHGQAHGSSCCNMACVGCLAIPFGPALPTAVEAPRPSVRHRDVVERILPGGLERPPKVG